MSAAADRWGRAGLRCEPADRAAAEAGVRLAYELAGLDPPAWIGWLDSPIQGAIGSAALSGTGPRPAWVEGAAGDWCGRVTGALAAQAVPIIAGTAGASVRERVWGSAWSTARAEVRRRVGPALWARAWALTGPIWTQLVDLLVSQVRRGVAREVEERLGPDPTVDIQVALLDAVLGQHEAGWLAAFDGLRHAVPGLDGLERLAGLMAVAEAAGWWWPFERVALLTERPVLLRRDDRHRLHQPDGPAVAYPDGFAVHAWHGMPVTPELTATLATLTVGRIQAEPNAELRRVMVEHYGEERYLREAGGRRLDHDDFGSLWQLPVRGDEPLVMVEVVNATPEPDGSRRRYWLRVPPSIRTARAAVAWTFGLQPDEYQPMRQS